MAKRKRRNKYQHKTTQETEDWTTRP